MQKKIVPDGTTSGTGSAEINTNAINNIISNVAPCGNSESTELDIIGTAYAVTVSIHPRLDHVPETKAEKDDMCSKLSARGWTPAPFTVDELAAHLDEGKAIAPLYRAGHRTNANVLASPYVWLDLDEDAPSVDELASHPFIMPHLAIIGETPSSTPDAPRCRVIIPLAEPITDGNEYTRLSEKLLHRFRDISPDETSAQPSRFAFGCQPGTVLISPGKLLTVDELAALPEPPQPDEDGSILTPQPAQTVTVAGNLTTADKLARVAPQIEAALDTAGRRANANGYVPCRCPFHDDHHKSAGWNREKYHLKCFKCTPNDGEVILARDVCAQLGIYWPVNEDEGDHADPDAVGLPDALRLYLLQTKNAGLARVLDALVMAGFETGDVFTANEAIDAIGDTLSPYTVREGLKAGFLNDLEGKDVFWSFCNTVSLVCKTSAVAKTPKNSPSPTRLPQSTRAAKKRRYRKKYAMPSIDALCSALGVKNGRVTPMPPDALHSKKTYRGVLIEADIKRRPARRSRLAMGKRVGLNSRSSTWRYQKDGVINVKSIPCFDQCSLSSYPDELPDTGRTGGRWIENEHGERRPANRDAVNAMKERGDTITVHWQTTSYYYHPDTEPATVAQKAPQHAEPSVSEFSPVGVQQNPTERTTDEPSPVGGNRDGVLFENFCKHVGTLGELPDGFTGGYLYGSYADEVDAIADTLRRNGAGAARIQIAMMNAERTRTTKPQPDEDAPAGTVQTTLFELPKKRSNLALLGYGD